ncbi:hypothetical protein SSX86_018472 [Deinandra increscens subsp. villosa]|uniref:MADS-box domain-containing protein n=1 Tax=Deinandra increscens subsp. villosa TaxID=3103831 RepID=A0AAP0CW30_9ASTR
MPRKGEGRQRIEIVRITKESSSSVALSKRRSGIFKKASELSTLCGAQIAIIVLSQTKKKVYSFGEPSVEAIVNRFVEQGHDPPPKSRTSQLMELLHNANIQELYTQLTSMIGELESLKKDGEEVQKIRKERQENYWWDVGIENMGLEELQQLKMAMLGLKDIAQKQDESLKAEAFEAQGVDMSITRCEGAMDLDYDQ